MDQVQPPFVFGAVLNYTPKAALFTVTASDLGNFFDNTGSYTISLTAAATLGARFYFFTRTISGTQVIDPSGAELINGAATLSALTANTVWMVVCTGSAWVAVQMPADRMSLSVGPLVVGDGTGAPTTSINGAAGQNRVLQFQTANLGRWDIRADATAEGGADAGSVLQVVARSDAGGALGVVWQITRAAGGSIVHSRATSITDTTSSATSITGALTVGNGAAPTSIGLGGGNLNAGGGAHLFGSPAGTTITVGIAAAAAMNRDLQWFTAASRRWVFRCDSTAEGGANAGSNFNLFAYDDSNVNIDAPWTIARVAGGTSTFSRPTSFTDTTEATTVTAAGVKTTSGLAVGKRSFLGTIGATFKGNVLAGVQDATAAVAGQVGEVISSVVSAVAVAATGTVGNITSITLTAGNWLIFAFGQIAGGATGLTSGSTAQVSVVTTTATNGTAGSTMTQQSILALLANGLTAFAITPIPVNINTSTTYFFTEQCTFAAGSPTASGTIYGVRIR